MRIIVHQQDSLKGKWDNSGATEQTLTCHGQFNWIYQKTIATEIQEIQEIKNTKFHKKIKVLNRCEDDLVKTNTWAPLFNKLKTFYVI